MVFILKEKLEVLTLKLSMPLVLTLKLDTLGLGFDDLELGLGFDELRYGLGFEDLRLCCCFKEEVRG